MNLKGPLWTRIAILPVTTIFIRKCKNDTMQAGIFHVSVNVEKWERNLMKNLSSSEVWNEFEGNFTTVGVSRKEKAHAHIRKGSAMTDSICEMTKDDSNV